MPVVQINGPLIARGQEVLEGSTLTLVVGLTAAKHTTAVTTNDPYSLRRLAKEVLITVESADVRWTCDGSTPTVTAGTGVGHLASAGDAILLTGFENIAKFRLINAVASNGARVNVTYFFE